MQSKHNKPPTQLLLTDIVIDPSLCVRDVDERIAEEYAEHIELLPPVVVWDLDEQYVLLDGGHRLRAHQIAGATHIRVVVMGGSRDEAQLYLAQCDARVGLRRSRAAKRIAIRLVLVAPIAAAWSDRKIGAHTGTSHTLVAQVRRELAGGSASYVAPKGGNIASERGDEGEQSKHPDRRAPSTFDANTPNGIRNTVTGEGELSDGELATQTAGNVPFAESVGAGPCSPAEDGGDRNLDQGRASGTATASLGASGGPGVDDVVRVAEAVLERCQDDDERRDVLGWLVDSFGEMLTTLGHDETLDCDETLGVTVP